MNSACEEKIMLLWSCYKDMISQINVMFIPLCWEVFLNVIKCCLKFEANERPTMNEVIAQLQHDLALQEEAGSNTSGDYNLLSVTFDPPVGGSIYY